MPSAARRRWCAAGLGGLAATLSALHAGPTAAASARPWEAATVPMPLHRLSRRAWYVQGDLGPVSLVNQGFNSNAGFVVTGDGVVVFDTLGTPALGDALLARIRSVTREPVRIVVVSHYHADHFYGLQPFKAAGAQVWAHRAALEYLATDAPRARLEERRNSLAPWVSAQARVVPPDRVLDGDHAFRVGGMRFEAIAAGPAHTPEDMMLLVPDEGVLFAGDLMFAGRVPFVGEADSRGWLAALDRLVARAPAVVVGGHGGASRDAAADIATTREYLRALREAMGRAVEDMVPFEEAFARTDWSRFAALPAFEAAHRRNAFNTYLRMERESLGQGR